MRIIVHGSELSAATAAAALASVGHRVDWYPHPETSWTQLAAADWLSGEPFVAAELTTSRESGALRIHDAPSAFDAQPEADIVWLALAPDQRDGAEQFVDAIAGVQRSPLVVVNNSTFPVGQTEALEALLRHASQVAVVLPDMLEEGRAWQVFTRPARWLLG